MTQAERDLLLGLAEAVKLALPPKVGMDLMRRIAGLVDAVRAEDAQSLPLRGSFY